MPHDNRVGLDHGTLQAKLQLRYGEGLPLGYQSGLSPGDKRLMEMVSRALINAVARTMDDNNQRVAKDVARLIAAAGEATPPESPSAP